MCFVCVWACLFVPVIPAMRLSLPLSRTAQPLMFSCHTYLRVSVICDWCFLLLIRRRGWWLPGCKSGFEPVVPLVVGSFAHNAALDVFLPHVSPCVCDMYLVLLVADPPAWLVAASM